nr:hypothetical protein [Anaerovibrio lipolyticus]
MFVKMYSRYSLVSTLLAMHVSIKLYAAALASAPAGEPENTQFFRPMVNGRMLLSARLLEMLQSPSRR